MLKSLPAKEGDPFNIKVIDFGNCTPFSQMGRPESQSEKTPGSIGHGEPSFNGGIGSRDDEEVVRDLRRMPAIAKAYYLRVLTDEFPAHQKRDRRVLLTLCSILDYCAKGRWL